MGFILWLMIGGVVGWLASIVMRRDGSQGIVLNIVVGIVGSILGALAHRPDRRCAVDQFRRDQRWQPARVLPGRGDPAGHRQPDHPAQRALRFRLRELDLVADLFAIHVPVSELMLRGTLVFWLLFLIFRFVLRRDVGAVGIADILLLVIVADAAQNAMSGGYDTLTEGRHPREHHRRLELAAGFPLLPFQARAAIREPGALKLVEQWSATVAQPATRIHHYAGARRKTSRAGYRRHHGGPRGLSRGRWPDQRDPQIWHAAEVSRDEECSRSLKTT